MARLQVYDDKEREERLRTSHKAAIKKYQKQKIETISVHVPPGTKERLRCYLDRTTGESINAFISRLIRENTDIEEENGSR